MAVRLVPFDRRFLDRSWEWLQDEETKRLTMTPDFTRQDQQRFFDSLPTRSDYRIWGVVLAGCEPIGAAGLKNVAGGSAEYWGYIGDKSLWGQGLGGEMLVAVEAEARRLGLTELVLQVATDNVRAMRAYENSGFQLAGEQAGVLVMRKTLEQRSRSA
jgi:RimJ/RimL family protein N-acetyltransferase